MVNRAEVVEVWARDGLIRIVGHLADGPGLTGPCVLEAVARRPTTFRGRLVRAVGRHRVRVTARTEGGEFDIALPVPALLPRAPVRRVWWDLRLRVPSGETVPVGRWDDDMPRKDRIISFPAQGAGGGSVRPYFTERDALAVRGARG